ncbi:hypothetical protein F441_14060 [Phytophthora nicotianae CJ01A1]|uniref:Uncharacterized protein n=3 Tax=Phytophthora nicotianae TaxID=4792 RepID=W2IKH7_PHYNI|nr:hypothetical protein L915_13774 [Phytophthora nicotianae]ETL34047.1 hypothetical protein L916_13671 [Phytophthora nicotianae]ETL87323.1 hypothetical protein L917_13479 [Phytophthora nicotianae]ETO69256.1 hypothetical protein F444_14162 [Phytophthora nicotianae P1976]ETP10299.1 hypothetical protein F441_14060 [Phytophthora nicotianae CJ01A1]
MIEPIAMSIVEEKTPELASHSSLSPHAALLAQSPVYATLGRNPVQKEADQSPFFDLGDGMKRPAWQSTLTFLLPDQRLADVPAPMREHIDVLYWIPY